MVLAVAFAGVVTAGLGRTVGRPASPPRGRGRISLGLGTIKTAVVPVAASSQAFARFLAEQSEPKWP